LLSLFTIMNNKFKLSNLLFTASLPKLLAFATRLPSPFIETRQP
jgi:hypothetical protein